VLRAFVEPSALQAEGQPTNEQTAAPTFESGAPQAQGQVQAVSQHNAAPVVEPSAPQAQGQPANEQNAAPAFPPGAPQSEGQAVSQQNAASATPALKTTPLPSSFTAPSAPTPLLSTTATSAHLSDPDHALDNALRESAAALRDPHGRTSAKEPGTWYGGEEPIGQAKYTSRGTPASVAFGSLPYKRFHDGSGAVHNPRSRSPAPPRDRQATGQHRGYNVRKPSLHLPAHIIAFRQHACSDYL